MPKYYVKSGQLEKIIQANNPVDAACDALEQCSGETLNHYFYIDERGFRDGNMNPITTEDVPDCLVPIEDIFMIQGTDNEMDEE